MAERALSSARRAPFAAASAALVIVSAAVAGMPEPLAADLGRRNPFTPSQEDWALYLMGAAAVAQAVYGRLAVLGPDKVEAALRREERFARLPAEIIAATVARNAAVMASLTLLYGIALVALTGNRGSYVPFALLALVQGASYYRAAGTVAGWAARRPAVNAAAPAPHHRYCPPLARGLSRGL